MTTTTPPSFAVGSWAFSAAHGESVRILDVETVWNHTVYQVWIPRLATVERVPADSLSPAQPAKATGLDRIAYAVAAARIADALTQDVLLAPLEAGVIPLPHQLHALTRVVTGDRVRYLLADEVGLGKTIEAGLIFRELKLRGLVKRVLVVAPKGLVTQWVQEMQTHFGEEFRLLTPSEFSSWRNLTGAENVWRQFDQVVCPADSIKPIERRQGWSREKLETHNQERLGDLIDAGWDLIICDEAHRLGGSTEQVARYRLGKALAEAAPYLLLLSATPHQGKTAGFQRIMALLDRDEFITSASIRREKVVPFVIRTEKRRAINDKGDPLFMPRLTKLVPVRWEEKHRLQKRLYESVTEYVRLGYNQAMRQNRQYLGFLMILMQRLVTSSTQAIATAMERRLEALQTTNLTATDEEPPENHIEEQDSQEQLEELLATRLAGLQNEKEEVRLLLDLARRCQAQGPDARAETLLGILYDNQREENNPELKYLIFTEFVPTQNMLRDFLEQHGFSVVCLNGSMDLEERRRVQRQFAEQARILVSTDAGGEGLNLQFAHIIINYDLPWNPMRIEQRIGRVDRIGQKLPVKAFNLIFEDSVELRVQEVLEEKLATILDEFGVDKTQDVLDSAESGVVFERLYAQAILNPGDIEKNIDRLIAEIPDLQLWLLEALLAASAADEIEAQQLLRLPEAFPFSLSVSVADLRRHEGFNIHRQGLDMDMVALRPVPPPPKPAPQASAKAQLRRVAKPQPADLFARGSAEYPVAEPQPVVVPIPTAPAPSAVVTPAPVYPFAVPSAECARLFEMGYYYAGIALTQAVIEAQVLYLGQVRLKRKPNLNGRFEKGLEALYKKRVISDEQHTRLAALLAEWRTLGYLQIAEADEPGKLAAIARQGLALLHELERGLLRMG